MSLIDTDVDDFIEEEENINTKKKTELDLALVNSFIFKENENRRRLEETPPQELDLYLSKFILAVRKKNGDEYEPTTLRGKERKKLRKLYVLDSESSQSGNSQE